MTCNGICSGAARLGAITGILLGEMKILNGSSTVLILTGILILISAFLIKVLPDMTKHRMPKSNKDVMLVQFSNTNTEPLSE